jgi:hypothetical protein
MFTLSENPGRGWFLRSFLGIGMTRNLIKQFARRGVTRSGGSCTGTAGKPPSGVLVGGDQRHALRQTVSAGSRNVLGHG